MNNLIKFFRVIVPICILMMLSCTNLEEQFLDSYASKEVEIPIPEGFLKTVHNDLVGLFTTQDLIYSLQEHSSDEMMGPTRGADWDDGGVWRLVHLQEWDPTHGQVTNVWNSLNSIQSNATVVVDNVSPDVQSYGEALFWRSFVMYHLVDLYGQVPFRTAEETDPFTPSSVMDRTTAFTFLINDLETAIPNLAAEGDPEVIDEGSPPYRSPTKEAAYALLAKAYLNKFVYNGESSASAADMDKVIEYTDMIISSDKFSLADDYFKLFYPDGALETENVLVFRGQRGDNVGNIGSRYYQTLHYNQNPSGWNGFTTLATFYDRFDKDKDKRYTGQDLEVRALGGPDLGFLEGQQYGQDSTVLGDRQGNPLVYTKDIPITGANERQGVRVVKWRPDYNPGASNGDTNHDYIYIRYADVLLMKAEALWRKGDPAGAMTIINDLRSNRGVDDIASIAGDGQEILDERGFELYWEGHRRTDLIRFGKFNDAWEEKEVTPDHVKLYPIPQTSIDANPNLQQNPGY